MPPRQTYCPSDFPHVSKDTRVIPSLGKDYPAVVKENDNTSCVDGLLLVPQNRSQRAKLDDFEGESYEATPVLVTVKNDKGEEYQVDADIYLWNGDLGKFMDESLERWLYAFGGMELVGEILTMIIRQSFHSYHAGGRSCSIANQHVCTARACMSAVIWRLCNVY